ncbi:MAG TPA: SMC-Scp complex subunit ScpB [Actinomycetes bacterium]
MTAHRAAGSDPPGASAPGDEARPQVEGDAPGQVEREPERDGAARDAAAAWPDDDLLNAVELGDRGLVRRDLEAVLLVVDEPVAAVDLAAAIGQPRALVEELLVELAGEYARDGRGFVLRAVAGGWRLYTHPGAYEAVESYVRAGQHSRLTRAALETIAVVAYRQPVTRLQVAGVRGVNVDGVFRTLLSRGLIREVGHDDGPGQATLYGTTPAFLEQLGLDSLDQLPPLKDYLPEGVDLADLQEHPGEPQ